MRNFLIALAAVVLIVGISSASEETYKVMPGDTLSEIARTHGVSWQELASLNRISDPTKMQAGITLRIPKKQPYNLTLSDGTVYKVTDDDVDLIARMIFAEARGESFDGQVAVASVILNRVKSSQFPNTVREVIYQPGQFTPVQNGTLPKKAGADQVQAVQSALQGPDPTGGALFFYNPQSTSNRDFWNTRTVIKRIGNHNFAL